MSAPLSPAPLAARARTRLGALLVAAGLISRERLDAALARQKKLNRRLGEVLLQMELIGEDDLGLVLQVQDALHGAKERELAGALSRRLGSILVASGALTSAQLAAALAEHERGGERLGEVLLRHGYVSPAALHGALAFQRTLAARLPERFRLGRMLVEAGVIGEDALEAALRRQAATGERLGEALVRAGAIGHEVLERFLTRQRRLTAALAAGLALAAGAAPLGQAHAAGEHRVEIVATVLRRASISDLRIPAEVAVTAADVARGYVELGRPITVVVDTNNPQGVLLGASPNVGEVSAVSLRPIAGEAGVSADGPGLRVAKRGVGLRKQSVRLRVRLELAPDAAPGVIRWPLALFVAPA